MSSNSKFDKIYKIVFLVVIAAFLFLVALNGRYAQVSGALYHDKWKNEIIIPDKAKEAARQVRNF